MAHKIANFDALVSNDNIANVYSEIVLSNLVETYMSPLGGIKPNLPSDTGELIQLVSANVADIGLLKVVGLGIDFKYLSETITLNGQIAVQTSKLFTRINNIIWLGPLPFLGLIKAQNLAGDTDYRSCSVDAQLSVDSLYSTPMDRKWQVLLLYAAIVRDANQQSTGAVSLYFKPIGSSYKRPFRFPLSMTGSSSATYHNVLPIEYRDSADFYLTALTSDAGTEVAARLSIKLES